MPWMCVEPVLDVEPARAAIGRRAAAEASAATAASLRQAAATAPDAGRRRLGAPPGRRARPSAGRHAGGRAAAAAAVVTPLKIMLDQVRARCCRPVRSRIESLPRELVADWTAVDGRARLLVLPQRRPTTTHRCGGSRRRSRPSRRMRPAGRSPSAASGDSVVDGLPAGRASIPFVAITLLLAVVLRRVRDVVLHHAAGAAERAADVRRPARPSTCR